MVRMPSCCLRLQAARERIPNSTGLPGGVRGDALERLAGRSQRTAERASPSGPCERVAWTAPPSQAARPQRDPALQSGVLNGKEHSAKNLLAPQETQQSGAQCTEPGRGRDSSHKPSPTQAPPRGAGGTEPNRGPPASSRRPGPTRVKPHSLSHSSLSVERGREHQPTP